MRGERTLHGSVLYCTYYRQYHDDAVQPPPPFSRGLFGWQPSVAMHLHPSRLEERRLRLCELKLHDATFTVEPTSCWDQTTSFTAATPFTPEPDCRDKLPGSCCAHHCRSRRLRRVAETRRNSHAAHDLVIQAIRRDSSRFVLSATYSNASTQVRAPIRARAQREGSRTDGDAESAFAIGMPILYNV
jgi:hypothetical protein